MDRVAVFVDAGYLFAQGSHELFGEKLKRGEMNLDHSAAVAYLKAFAETQSNLKLLRIYWYDGTSQGPSPQHIALAELTDVKIRLGFVNSYGQQKGVDSLIITDMITLARNRAMAECVLLSGDEDLRVGVQVAQEYGVRVHLIGIKPARGSQSLFLLQEADVTYQWEASDLGNFMKRSSHTVSELLSEDPTPEPSGSSDAVDPLEKVARNLANKVPEGEVATLFDSILQTKTRPKQIDAPLLASSRNVLGHDLDSAQKSKVRKAFLKALEVRLNELSQETNQPPIKDS
ncbi:MAG: NYN domain-containing protein [Bryobacterales bacterium]|nr:NYN domain-containing protein [Bryobacterales bacterium]MDE0294897.1 NYN domain-containing protein [Bryobacterales bacterium]